MDIQLTKKEIRSNSAKILSVAYCDAQSLLRYQERIGYSAGVSGWSCDYYKVDSVIICTGYRTIGTPVNREILKKYETKAKNINCQTYDYCEKRTNKLLRAWIAAEIETEKK